SNTTSSSLTVTATVITADFTVSPTSPSITNGTNVNVTFDATGSSASVTSWSWDFGDGTAGQTGQKTTHTFTKAGTWVVRLTVSDAAGRSGTTTKNVTVTP